MEQLSKQTRERVILIGGIVLLLSAAMISYLVIPEYKKWLKLSEQLTILEGVVVEADLTEQIDMGIQEISRLNQQLHGEGGSIQLSEIEAFVIQKLEQNSKRHKIKLTSVQPLPRRDIKQFKEVSFHVKVVGNYADIYAWLISLQSEMGFIAINQLSMTQVSNSRQQYAPNALSAELKLVTYRMNAS